jgi:hypothetical protein
LFHEFEYDKSEGVYLRIYTITDPIFNFEVLFVLAVFVRHLTSYDAHIKVLEQAKIRTPQRSTVNELMRPTDVGPAESKLSFDQIYFDCFQFIGGPVSKEVKLGCPGWSPWSLRSRRFPLLNQTVNPLSGAIQGPSGGSEQQGKNKAFIDWTLRRRLLVDCNVQMRTTPPIDIKAFR